MKCKRSTSNFFLVLALLSLIGNASSQTLEVTDVNVNPSVVWLNENPRITVSAKCRYNNSVIQADDALVEIKSPAGLTTTENLAYSGGTYSNAFLLYGFSEIGTYTASVTCDYNSLTDTKKKTFTVREMELSIIKEGSEIKAYMGEVIEVRIDFRVDGKQVSLARDDYKIVVGDVEAEPISVIGTTGYQTISVDLCPEDDIEDCMDDLPEGLYDLEITAYYSTGQSVADKVKNYVRVKPPIKLDFSKVRVECVVGQLCSPSITFGVTMTSGDVSELSEDDVSVRILGNRVFESVYVEDLQCDKQAGSCTVKLNIPSNLQPGSYDLFLSVEKKFGDNSYTIEEPIDLKVVLQFSGYMKDAAGEVVSSVITLTNSGTGQVVSGSTDYSGRYSLDVLPGVYVMEARFGGAIIRFNNVSFSSDDFLLGISGNLLRYDEGHLHSGSPSGVRIVKVLAVELALPFYSAWFFVPYNSALVSGDENNLRVYKCANWNFEKGFCNGEWKQIAAEVHPIRNAVEFYADSTSAFIVGEQRALYLQSIELQTQRVFIGENIVVDGKVWDSDGNPVEGAQIRLSFPEFGITSSATSTTGGFFRATITAPYTSGYPSLLIEASKETYISSNVTTTVGVDMKKEVSVFGVPESVEIKLGEPKSLRFKIFNSGQINLTDTILLRVNGIPQGWYRLSDVKIDSLEVSEQKEIEMTMEVTPELCGADCGQFYLTKIEATSEEVSDVASFTLVIASSKNQTTSAPDKDSGGLIKLPDITGFSISVPKLSNSYLPLSFIVILLILIVNKKKSFDIQLRKRRPGRKEKGAPKLRDSVMASLNKIKKQI
ncbi:MAG: hypothetical protein JW778_00710 [Candidatus Altiarchaeota archaeon]|nr:hypothetical protein [Candidatus Altiarchaeota archaeon]